MNWEAIGAIGEVVGVVGVIASLFYLASQIRRNARSVEAATIQAVAVAKARSSSQLSDSEWRR